MHAEGRHYRDIASAILSRPDEVMLEVGAGGELLVARLRVVIAAMLLLLPLANAATGGQFNETLIGLAGAVFVNLFAQVCLEQRAAICIGVRRELEQVHIALALSGVSQTDPSL